MRALSAEVAQVRRPAQEDVLRHGHARRHLRLLDQHRDATREISRAQSGDWVSADHDVALKRYETGDRTQDRRLARTVGPDQRQPLAGRDGQIQVPGHRPALVTDRNRGEDDRAHSGAPRVDLMTTMKNGAPRNAVITPIGSSAGATIVRAAVSARTRNAAPKSTDRGITTR